MHTIKEVEVDLTGYEDLADARKLLGRFPDDVYSTERTHSSMGYLPPSSSSNNGSACDEMSRRSRHDDGRSGAQDSGRTIL
jgi:hypothetical protein